MKKQFANIPHWSIHKWISVLVKGGGQKKRFQCCVNPNYPQKFLYLRAIQGHSGSTINLALQDNVLLPEGVTEYIYHVGKGKEWRSIVNHGLIPGGVSLRTGRQAVFFTVVNLMDNQDGIGETLCDLSQARIAPYKNTWKHFQDTVSWCNLKLAQQRGLQFYQTRSNAVLLDDTLLAEFIEKATCMKIKDQLYQRESVILRPRVILEADSQSEQDHLGNRNKMERATVKPEATMRTTEYQVFRFQRWNCRMHGDKRTSQNLSRYSKHIGIRNNSLKTWVKRRRSTGSAKHPKKLLQDMDQTEILELCENSAKLQCPDCNSFTELGIIYCSCGRNLKYKRSPTTTQKANCDFSWIPGFVINWEEFQSRTKTWCLWKTGGILQDEGDA